MSSILDALNKLEEEKKEAARTAAESAIDPRMAARELVGRMNGRPRYGHVSPLLWGVAGICVFSLVVVSAAMGVYFMVRPSLQPQSVSAVSPAPSDLTVANAEVAPPLVQEAVPSNPEPPVSSTLPTVPSAQVNVPAVAPPAPAIAKAPEPVPVEPVPDPAPVTAASTPPAPATPAPVPEPTPATTTAPLAPATPAPKPFEVASAALPSLPWMERAAKTEPAAEPSEESSTARADAETPAAVASTPLPPVPQSLAPRSVLPDPGSPAPGPAPSDISKLPVLRESDKARMGFEDVKINMVQPKSESRPFARAIINLKPVVIGERIPDTRTTLIGVAINGIAVEMNGSRERYFVPFGYSL